LNIVHFYKTENLFVKQEKKVGPQHYALNRFYLVGFLTAYFSLHKKGTTTFVPSGTKVVKMEQKSLADFFVGTKVVIHLLCSCENTYIVGGLRPPPTENIRFLSSARIRAELFEICKIIMLSRFFQAEKTENRKSLTFVFVLLDNCPFFKNRKPFIKTRKKSGSTAS